MNKSFSVAFQVLGLILAALGLVAAVITFLIPYCDSKLAFDAEKRTNLSSAVDTYKQASKRLVDSRERNTQVQLLVRLNADFIRDVRNSEKATEIIGKAWLAIKAAEKSELNINRSGYDDKWYGILTASGFDVDGPIWYWPTKELSAPADALQRIRGSIGDPQVLEAYIRDLERMRNDARGRHQELMAGLRGVFASTSPPPPGEVSRELLARRLETVETEVRSLEASSEAAEEAVTMAKGNIARYKIPYYCRLLQ